MRRRLRHAERRGLFGLVGLQARQAPSHHRRHGVKRSGSLLDAGTTQRESLRLHNVAEPAPWTASALGFVTPKEKPHSAVRRVAQDGSDFVEAGSTRIPASVLPTIAASVFLWRVNLRREYADHVAALSSAARVDTHAADRQFRSPRRHSNDRRLPVRRRSRFRPPAWRTV